LCGFHPGKATFSHFLALSFSAYYQVRSRGIYMQQSAKSSIETGTRIALFLPSLKGGGLEKVFLDLAQAFMDEGHVVDLILTRLEGEFLESLPASLNVIELKAASRRQSLPKIWQAVQQHRSALIRPVLMPFKSSRILRFLPALTGYVEQHRPEVLISAMTYPNLVAIMARRLAGVPTRVVVTEHNTLSRTIENKRHKWRWRYLPPLMRRLYPYADRLVAVSDGVASDLAATAGLPRQTITTGYNPVVSPLLSRLAKAPPESDWFAPGAPPVVLAVGRFSRAKGFDVLIRAFARLRAQRHVHLLILGDGQGRKALEAQIAKLGLKQDVRMPGFTSNPYRYMARADLFVLSSRYEGLGNVLIEALACGCPVVSTDCPSGPREILENGRYGLLEPVDDEEALALAMARTLDCPPKRDRLKRRAQSFSLENVFPRYREISLG
jgi:glycosyltransferase involved in cell wall biosynthesis